MSEIFVNTVNYNGSKTAKLMRLFTVNDAYSIDEFPVTSKLKAMLKSSEGGAKVMNELLEKLISDEKKESEKLGEKRGEKRGAENEKIRMAKDMKKKSLPFSLISEITGLSENKILSL